MLEARMTVGETAELPRRLQVGLTDAVAVLLENRESFQVVGQPFYDGWEKFRVHVQEVVPSLFEVGEFRPKRGHARLFGVFIFVLVEAVERVVVQLPTNVSVAVQLLAVGVGRLRRYL